MKHVNFDKSPMGFHVYQVHHDGVSAPVTESALYLHVV